MRTHKHRCDDCKTIWEHEGPTAETTSREYVKRHACPNCGAEQYGIYRTPDELARVKKLDDILDLIFT